MRRLLLCGPASPTSILTYYGSARQAAQALVGGLEGVMLIASE
jgi:hypothetical protein